MVKHFKAPSGSPSLTTLQVTLSKSLEIVGSGLHGRELGTHIVAWLRGVTCVINCTMCMAVCVWRVTGPVCTADLPLARAIRITSYRVETDIQQ